MPKRKSQKELITEAVLVELGRPSSEHGIDEYIKSWWFTRSGDSLRLLPAGDQALRTAEIEFFDVPLSIKHVSWYQFLSDCSKKLKCPYFIGLNKIDGQKNQPYIRLYDSKIAMMLTLYGDIQSYLDSVKVRR